MGDQNEKNVSSSRNIGSSVSQNRATHLALRYSAGALSAHHATANQPIDQPLVVEAYLKLCSRQGRVSGGQKGEKCHCQLGFNC